MNSIVAALLMLWLTGWTLAFVWAGIKAGNTTVGAGLYGKCRRLGLPRPD